MGRKDRVLSALTDLYEQRSRGPSETDARGVSARAIADHLGILRNNCCADLNDLVREGVVRKIGGRPTLYCPARDTALATGVEQALPPLGDLPLLKGHLRSLIGAERSLKEAVERAMMAVRYPPSGMHVLLLGETGVGKSTFAKAMHRCAVAEGTMAAQAPFIPFNCAEYASNPEILLDHLFGHAKGAYTGADKDKPGLIELANGGILFLDEVHRLPPHGQEMLFHLLDYGEYQRMGETSSWRRSQVLLIAATTEPPSSTLLATFRRRIPMVIALPSLREWDIRDRFELVHALLYQEACSTERTYRLSAEALGSLLFAHFPANIGDLRNVLRLACANTLLSHPPGGCDEVAQLRPQVHMYPSGRQNVLHRSSASALSELVVGPSDKDPHVPEGLQEQSLYAQMNRLTRALDELGFADDEIISAIERELHRREKEYFQQQSLSELQRFVGDDFYAVMLRCWSPLEQEIDDMHRDSAFMRISMHLYGVTRTMQQPLPDLARRMQRMQMGHAKETDLAERLLQLFFQETGVQLPAYEVPVLTMLLKQTAMQRRLAVGVVVVLRGDGVASQLVASALEVFPDAHVVAVDVALHQSLTDTQSLLQDAVAQVDAGDGILVMTDILSLRERIRSMQPGTMAMRLVWRPDFSLLVHALQICSAGRTDVGELAVLLERYGGRPVERDGGPRTIWTCCLTGKGTAQALKRLIEQELPPDWRTSVKVIPIDILPNSQTDLPPCQDVVAAVGSIDPGQPGVPFLSVEQLLAPQGMQRLMCLLGNAHLDVRRGDAVVGREWEGAMVRGEVPAEQSGEQSGDQPVEALPLLDYTKAILERDLVFANPRHVCAASLRMTERVEAALAKPQSPEWRARFLLHMGYVIERGITRDVVIHPYAMRIQKQFPTEWSVLCSAWQAIEEVFRLPVDANELAFVFDMVFSERGYEVRLS